MPERFLVKPRNLKASFVLIAMLQQFRCLSYFCGKNKKVPGYFLQVGGVPALKIPFFSTIQYVCSKQRYCIVLLLCACRTHSAWFVGLFRLLFNVFKEPYYNLLMRDLYHCRAFVGHCRLRQHSTTNCDAHRAAITFWFVLKNWEYIEFHGSIVWL